LEVKVKNLIVISLLLLAGSILPTSLFADVVIEEWVARYNGPGNFYDYGQAIAVDNSGNVYVTGYSYGIGTRQDYATVKYAPDGTQLWVARYNGPGNSYDYVQAIAVDSSGNVYVTGRSMGSATVHDYDYATVKYDTNGNELWVARYNGPANSYDIAEAIAVDGSGDVYVTGRSVGSGTSYYDYATVKYAPDGTQLWVARYNGPGNSSDYAYAIAMDSSCNVYVTGQSWGSGTRYDYATVKYDTNGKECWVKRYDGPGNWYDYAYAIAVDNSGNVYVTGYSYGSGTSYDYATVKYAPDGTQLWVARYNGPGNSYDYVHAIAMDSLGNVYVTGYSYGSGTSYDYATVKYAPDGTQLWVARYNGPGNSHEYVHAIAMDSLGNVYVTGYSPGSGTSYDYATVKYAPDGTQLWVARYNGPGNSYDYGQAIAVDSSGNVYVTGWSIGISTYFDYATVKYSQVLFTTPAEGVSELIKFVESFNLKQGIENSLDAKLQNALAALDAANAGLRQDAINKMQAFINSVEAQRGNALTDDQADSLVDIANAIILLL